MLHTIRTPFVRDDADAKFPIRFYDGRSFGTIELRRCPQYAVYDAIRILLAAKLLFQTAQGIAKAIQFFAIALFKGLLALIRKTPFRSKNVL